MNENDIKFMKIMEEKILPFRGTGTPVSNDDIRDAANAVGYNMNGGGCATCFRNYAIDLINTYGQLESTWIAYKNSLSSVNTKKKK